MKIIRTMKKKICTSLQRMTFSPSKAIRVEIIGFILALLVIFIFYIVNDFY